MTTGFISDAGPPWWFLLLPAVPLLLLGAAWLFLAATVAFRGDNVDKPNRMAQFYGYSVCLIAIVVALMSANSLIAAAFERANPLESEAGYGVSLVSFESYKASSRREQAMLERTAAQSAHTTSDATLRNQYDAAVRDRVVTARYQTTKSFVSGTFFLLVACVLFYFHWRWVRRLNDKAAA